MSSLVMSRPLLFYPSWLPWAVTSWGDLLAATVVAQWLSLSSSCSFLPGILPTSRIIRMEAPGGQGSPASAGIFLGRWSRNSASSGTPTCSLGCRPVHCVMLGMLCNPRCLVVSSSATSACRALEMWNRIFCCSLFLKLNVVVQLLSLLWLYDPMDCSTPRLPCPSPSPRVCSNSCPLSQWCHAAIILHSPLSSPLNLSQHQGLFQWVGSLHQVAKVWQLQHLSLQWIFRVDFL